MCPNRGNHPENRPAGVIVADGHPDDDDDDYEDGRRAYHTARERGTTDVTVIVRGNAKRGNFFFSAARKWETADYY